MKTTAILAAFVCFGVLVAPSLYAQDEKDRAEKARQAGLQMHWFSQVQIDSAREHVVDVDLHVHDKKSTTFYEIRYGNQRETVAFTDVNLRGEMYGEQGAADRVAIRKEMLEAEGHEVEVNLYTIPETTIYAMTTSGVIHAVDAETGRTRWITRVGWASHPSTGIAVNNERVMAVKGSNVYCLDAENGRIIWERPTKSSPLGGMALSDKYGYVTTLGGFLLAYPMNDSGIPVEHFVATGRSVWDPIVTATTVSWASENGRYNVALNDRVKSIDYRLKTQSRILASGASAGNLLIVNAYGGKVYAIDELNGKIVWEYATGERLLDSPVSIGSDVILVISGRSNLFALRSLDGKVLENWPDEVPGISKYVGASEELLYFMDVNHNLVGLRRDNGSIVNRIHIGEHNIMIPNNQTDRLYVGQSSGLLACFREITSLNPYLHGDDIKGSIQRPVNPFDMDAPAEAPADAPPPEKAGDAADPFGDTGKKDAKKGDDPFGDG